MKDISKTQKRIYEYLLERSQDGVPPSVREIGAAVGLSSTSSVQANLDALEQAGYIQRDPLKKRTIRILGRETDEAYLNEVLKVAVNPDCVKQVADEFKLVYTRSTARATAWCRRSCAGWAISISSASRSR